MYGVSINSGNGGVANTRINESSSLDPGSVLADRALIPQLRSVNNRRPIYWLGL